MTHTLPWAPWWPHWPARARRCRARLHRPETAFHGRCQLLADHPEPHAHDIAGTAIARWERGTTGHGQHALNLWLEGTL